MDITEREKELLRDDVYHDILEFAESYYNTHERSPEGTIMATLTRKGRKSVDMVPKYEMITYYRGNTIPSSHIHMYDPENVTIACNIFRVSVPLGLFCEISNIEPITASRISASTSAES